MGVLDIDEVFKLINFVDSILVLSRKIKIKNKITTINNTFKMVL
ncbi:MAG: hypothetical protein QXD23_01990 [Candidatus Micrarchaeaceae archaeon]